MTTRRRRRHTPEQIVRKHRDADAMLNAGKDEAAVQKEHPAPPHVSTSAFSRQD